jgi:hypothetical protein
MNSHKGTHSPSGSGGKDKTSGASSEASQSKSGSDAAKSSGRAAFDSRGNSIWEFETDETGKFSSDVNTHFLKKLDAPELTLEDTAKVGKIDRPETQENKFGAGFNPYDRGSLSGDARKSSKSEPPPRKPIKDLRRYDEWLKMKQRLAEKKDDD